MIQGAGQGTMLSRLALLLQQRREAGNGQDYQRDDEILLAHAFVRRIPVTRLCSCRRAFPAATGTVSRMLVSA
jgi:hypothetical protein